MIKKRLLTLFHRLPAGLKLFLRSFKNHEPELYLLDRLVNKSSLVVDVGANKGAYTYALCRIVGSKGKVVAFEPIHELAADLRDACSQLKFPVEVDESCLSSETGEGELCIPFDGNEMLSGYASLGRHQDNEQVRKVNVDTLDHFLKDRQKRISFIKCDVEGHELEVFKGAIDILQKDRPNLLIEIEQRHVSAPIADHFTFFDGMGYQGFFLDDNGKVCNLNSTSIDELSAGQISGQNRYINNFIFIPKEVAVGDVFNLG